MKFHVSNMTCGGCAKSIGKAIASVDSNAEVNFDITNRMIEFQSDHDVYLFTLAIAAEGYDAVLT